jgi:hypothetical protein
MTRKPATGLSDSDQQFQIVRQSEAVNEPFGKSAEDPSWASRLGLAQEAVDPQYQITGSSPAVDEGSEKVAEDPSAMN